MICEGIREDFSLSRRRKSGKMLYIVYLIMLDGSGGSAHWEETNNRVVAYGSVELYELDLVYLLLQFFLCREVNLCPATGLFMSLS